MKEKNIVKTINYIKIILAILLLLLISKSVFSQNINYETMRANFNSVSMISIDGDITEVIMNITCPQNTENQKTTYLEKNFKFIKDKEGNTLCMFHFNKNPENIYTAELNGYVDIKAIHTKNLKKEYTYNSEISKYLEPTEHIQSDNPVFKNIASNITEGAESEFEKIAKLAIWVNKYMTYDLRYSDKNHDALFALTTKRGVCSEYSTLYIALARSIGIPSRYVSAYALGEHGWERHGYAESYIGGVWVPVDPLWLQIGYLDATHIKFGTYKDNQVEHDVSFKGYELKNSKWIKDEYVWSVSSNKTLDSIPYEYETNKPEYFAGEKGAILFHFNPEEYSTAKIILTECYGETEILKIDNPEKNLILLKGIPTTVYWTFSINKNLPKNRIYTCPVYVNSKSFNERAINIVVDTSKKETYFDDINIIFNPSEKTKEQQLYISGNFEKNTNVWVIHNNRLILNTTISGKWSKLINLESKTGENELFIVTNHNFMKKYRYYVKQNKANYSLYIPSIERVNQDVPIKLEFTKNTESIKLILNYDNKSITKTYSNKKTINEIIKFQKPGIKKIELILYLNNQEYKISKYINIIDQPEISITSKKIGSETKVFLENKGYDAKNITLNLMQKKYTFECLNSGNTKEITLRNLNSEELIYTLKYQDLLGKEYTLKGTLKIEKETLWEKIKRIISGFWDAIVKFINNY